MSAERARADRATRALLRALDSVVPAERTAFVLHDLFGMSVAAIATALECSPDDVQRRVIQARARVWAWMPD